MVRETIWLESALEENGETGVQDRVGPSGREDAAIVGLWCLLRIAVIILLVR